jgi:ABC-2 type transport system permease protein
MNLTYLRMEIVRLRRNKRVWIFSIAMPVILLLIFGSLYKDESLNGASASAYLMVSMGLFGSMSAALGAGSSIAVERGIGWNRQLRLTPLRPVGYVLAKLILALVVALPPLLVTFAVGAGALHVRLSTATWLAVAGLAWLGALPFAALGILIGYVAKPDSVQQVSTLVNLLLAAFGGIWVPVEQMPHLMHRIAEWTPAYWVGVSARGPLFHQHFDTHALMVLAGWTLVIGLVALRRFRADTARA